MAQGLPGLAPSGTVAPYTVFLAEQDAAATLDAIESGEVATCILPWLVLMRGGGEASLIARWKAVAAKEPNADRRELYASLALTFAELSPFLVSWQKQLEGWEMRESKFLTGIMNEGRVDGELKRGRAYIVRGLSQRLNVVVPEAVKLALDGTNDPAILDRWFDIAMTCPDLDSFVAAMRTPQP